jgi:uncharacterized RDD family membrane protein YckC
MASINENRYAPPQAAVSDVALDASGPVPASRGRRLGAVILDSIILGTLNVGVLALFGRSIFTRPADGAFVGYAAGNVSAGVLVFLVVNGYLLATRGQTVAKMILGLRIVRPDGERASAGRILGLRYGVGFLLGIVPLLGGIYGLIDALMIFRDSRRCLHDNIADTIVIRA